jgi:hypothetical protein
MRMEDDVAEVLGPKAQFPTHTLADLVVILLRLSSSQLEI